VLEIFIALHDIAVNHIHCCANFTEFKLYKFTFNFYCLIFLCSGNAVVGVVKVNWLTVLLQTMLCSQQEKSLLQDAVKTMMAQICKVGVPYHSELQIEGTVVVTVDQQKVIVIHFNDHLPLQPTVQQSQPGNGIVIPTSSHDAALSDGCRLVTGESSNYAASAVSGLSSPGSCQPAKSGWYEGSSTSKMMNSITGLDETWNDHVAIDLDSEPDAESQSVNTPNFEDNINEDNSSSFSQGDPMNDVTLPRECQPALGQRKVRRVKDAKKVIVIEDELFNSVGTLHETVETVGELKRLNCGFVGRSSASSTADCESIEDAGEMRCLNMEFSPERDPNISGLRSAVLACEICGWHARTVSHLESHLVSQHGITESERLGHFIKSVSCPVCNKRFRFQAQLSKHMAVHSAPDTERPYRCQICRNSYRHADSLALHSRVHDESTKKGSILYCTLCYKTYPNKVLFQKHINYMHERVGGK